MSKINWIDYDDSQNIAPKNYQGCVYVIEWAKYIKIGSTKKIKHRFNQLVHQATHYGDTKIGRCVITELHTNYVENEKKLHAHFAKSRKPHTELFTMSLDMFIAKCPQLELKQETEMKEQLAERNCEALKALIMNGVQKKPEHKPVSQKIIDYVNTLDLSDSEKDILAFDNSSNITIFNPSEKFAGVYLVMQKSESVLKKIEVCKKVGFLIIIATEYSDEAWQVIEAILTDYMNTVKS